MDESPKILRLELDGRWTADEFGTVLINLADLYSLRLILEILNEESKTWSRHYPKFWDELPRIRQRLPSDPYLFPFSYWPTLPSLDETFTSRASQFIGPRSRLMVRRVEYASPGLADLAGIGAIVGHLKDFVLKLIERHDTKRSRELADEKAEIENQAARIQNAKEFVALAKSLGYANSEIRDLVRSIDDKQEPIVHLISEQKLIGASLEDAD